MSKITSSDAAAAPGTLAHWGHIAVFFLTLGFVFPHALIERGDPGKIDADNKAGGSKK